MADFAASRRETLRYHRELFARTAAELDGSWCGRPHRIVVDALALIRRPVRALDLGSGIGRHTLLMARDLPAGSTVTAVDLLPSALQRLALSAADAGLADRVDVVAADLATYRFPADGTGLVVAFSALEHVGSAATLAEVLGRCRRATHPGGIHVIAIHADRREITQDGVRPALIECPLTAAQAGDLLARAYRGWDVVARHRAPSRAVESRDGESYELHSTLVGVVARAP